MNVRPGAVAGLRCALACAGIALALAGGGALAAASPIAALGAPDKAAAPAPPADPAGPISAAQIPARATAAEAVARAAVERARANDVEADLGARYASLAGSIESFRGLDDMQRLDELSIPRLEMLKRQWSFYAAELDELQRQLARRTAGLSSGAAELEELQQAWHATAEATTMPEPLRARAAAVATMLDAAGRLQDRPLAAALALQQQVSIETTRVARLQRQVEDALAYADHRLFEIDVPPLWEVAAPASTALAFRPLRADRPFVAEFFRANRHLVRAWVATSAMLLGLVIWLRRKSRDWLMTDNDLRDTARLLLRPWSAWLLLALLAAMFVFARAPGVFGEVVLLALVVPLLRLLPAWLMKGSRAGLYGIAALFVVDRLRYLAGDPATFRHLLLAVALLGAGVLGWVAWRARRSAAVPEKWRFATALAASFGALLLLVAAASNAIGNVTLADLLTRGTTRATFAAVLLFAWAAVLRGVIALLLSTQLARRLKMIERHGDVVMRTARRLVTFVAVAAWLGSTATSFRLWQALVDDATAVLSETWQIGDLTFSLGGVLLFVLGVLAAWKIAHFVRFTIDEELLSRVDWPRGVESAISTLSFYAVAAFGFLVVLGATGVETGKFAIVAGALGVGIGFGLQNVVNNFVSGLILMFERPIQPGDIVELAGIQGTVKSIGMRATSIETFEGAEVIVPNGTLLQGNLTNWTLSDKTRRIEIPVGVAYGTDPKVVIAILREVAVRQPQALKWPEPAALFVGFGDSSLNFSLRFWTAAGDAWVGIRSQALVEIHDELAKAGIEIPFPQRDLHVRSVSADALRAVAAGAGPSAASSTAPPAAVPPATMPSAPPAAASAPGATSPAVVAAPERT